MKRIFKASLPVYTTKCELSKVSQVYSCGNQEGNICIWYASDEKSGLEYEFRFIETGDFYPKNGWLFLGTIHFLESKYIKHAFYRVKQQNQ